MPRKLFDESGNEVEVPEEKELEELKKKAEKAGEIDKFNELTTSIRQTLGIEEKDDLVMAIKEAKEAANPNFKALRKKISSYEAFIKANNKDVQFDDEGNVKNSQAIDPQKIVEESKQAAIKAIYEREISQRLGKYPEDKRAAVKSYFDKLSAGEDINTENIEKYMSEAEKLVEPAPAKVEARLSGEEPRLSPEGAKFVESARGKEAAESIFGDESFTKVKKDNK